MNLRKPLCLYPSIYGHDHSDALFLDAMRDTLRYHQKNCPPYRKILRKSGFRPGDLKTARDLASIPPLPTSFLKTRPLWSMPSKIMAVHATSSGTRGAKSQIGYDAGSLLEFLVVTARVAHAHGLWSMLPTNYLLLGYQPHKQDASVITKTQNASRLFTPLALHTEYALRRVKDGYHLDFEHLRAALDLYSRFPFPVRIIGFPAYTYFFLLELQKQGIRYRLPRQSMVILGGGWKQFYKDQVDKADFYQLVHQVLGLSEDRCVEFFGAAEHLGVFCSCKRHHFHIPVTSRAIIRDVHTLEPVSYGTPGLINLLTPLARSMPLSSIMTDDLGVLHPGESCGCGISAPYLEIIGRVGMKEIKTCAAKAQEYLQ